ncbi:MFS transporter [Georgenia ruanii]|uniref:MFS transporter n=1 Tax=Georgenia ruanii TaxID=348442 RepID=A0A7J9V155_9MICO|nr:MFS transporter [Georgenia ruanii]MPV89694.1 MFS transporter [Georgenia ruanii]
MTRTRPAEPLWTPDFVLAALVNFCVGLVYMLLMTTMALYAVERFGASDALAGLAAGMFIVGSTAGRLFAGNLVDLVGRKRVLVIALVVYVLAALSYLPATALPALLVVRCVHGVAFGVGSTAAISIAQGLIPPLRRAEGTGYFALSTTLSTAAGPFLALLLVRGPGYTALFAAAVIASGLAMVLALVLRAPVVRLDPARRARLRRFHPADLLDARVLPVAGVMLVLGVGYSGVVTFVNSYGTGLGLAEGTGAFFLAYAAVLFVSRLLVGRVQDRRGDNVVVYPAIASFALGLLLLARVTTDAGLVLAAALVGLGFGTFVSAGQAIAVGQVPPVRIGVAVSTFYFMLDVGTGLGPIVLGVVVGAAGYREMYLTVAVVVALSAGLYHLAHGRRARAAGQSM